MYRAIPAERKIDGATKHRPKNQLRAGIQRQIISRRCIIKTRLEKYAQLLRKKHVAAKINNKNAGNWRQTGPHINPEGNGTSSFSPCDQIWRTLGILFQSSNKNGEGIEETRMALVLMTDPEYVWKSWELYFLPFLNFLFTLG